MNKVLLSLQDTEPVHGDVATVHELIETHEVHVLCYCCYGDHCVCVGISKGVGCSSKEY